MPEQCLSLRFFQRERVGEGGKLPPEAEIENACEVARHARARAWERPFWEFPSYHR